VSSIEISKYNSKAVKATFSISRPQQIYHSALSRRSVYRTYRAPQIAKVMENVLGTK